MDPDTLFTLCNNAVIPFWLMLMLAPRWRWTQRLVHTFIIPSIFCVLYLVLGLANFFSGDGDFFSLSGVATLFQVPGALLAGWIHYLVFDLFIGAWESRDALRLKIPHLLVVPCLLFTFMLGPVGLLLYLIVRWTIRRRFFLDDFPEEEGDTAEAA